MSKSLAGPKSSLAPGRIITDEWDDFCENGDDADASASSTGECEAVACNVWPGDAGYEGDVCGDNFGGANVDTDGAGSGCVGLVKITESSLLHVPAFCS